MDKHFPAATYLMTFFCEDPHAFSDALLDEFCSDEYDDDECLFSDLRDAHGDVAVARHAARCVREHVMRAYDFCETEPYMARSGRIALRDEATYAVFGRALRLWTRRVGAPVFSCEEMLAAIDATL